MSSTLRDCILDRVTFLKLVQHVCTAGINITGSYVAGVINWGPHCVYGVALLMVCAVGSLLHFKTLGHLENTWGGDWKFFVLYNM